MFLSHCEEAKGKRQESTGHPEDAGPGFELGYLSFKKTLFFFLLDHQGPKPTLGKLKSFDIRFT